jgi:hypothetical protein
VIRHSSLHLHDLVPLSVERFLWLHALKSRSDNVRATSIEFYIPQPQNHC